MALPVARSSAEIASEQLELAIEIAKAGVPHA